MALEKRPDGRWRVIYRDSDGIRRNKSFGRGPEAEKEAIAFDHDIKRQKVLGRRVGFVSARKGLHLEPLLVMYIQERQARGISEKFLNELYSTMVNHIIPLLPKKPVNALNYLDFVPVMEKYGNHSTSTRNHYMRYLKTILNFGLDHDLIQHNPLAKWKKEKETKQPLKLTAEHVLKIHKEAVPHLKWAIDLEWNLGTRPGPSELLSLRWEDVDFDESVVKVIGRKTRELRLVPFEENFKKRLLAMKKKSQSGHLIEFKGKPIKSLRRAFNTACRKAGIPFKVRLYDIRHHFATIMLARGGDLKAVSKLLGHSSTKMTSDTYYHLLQAEKRRAISLIPDLMSGEKGDKEEGKEGKEE